MALTVIAQPRPTWTGQPHRLWRMPGACLELLRAWNCCIPGVFKGCRTILPCSPWAGHPRRPSPAKPERAGRWPNGFTAAGNGGPRMGGRSARGADQCGARTNAGRGPAGPCPATPCHASRAPPQLCAPCAPVSQACQRQRPLRPAQVNEDGRTGSWRAVVPMLCPFFFAGYPRTPSLSCCCCDAAYPLIQHRCRTANEKSNYVRFSALAGNPGTHVRPSRGGQITVESHCLRFGRRKHLLNRSESAKTIF